MRSSSIRAGEENVKLVGTLVISLVCYFSVRVEESKRLSYDARLQKVALDVEHTNKTKQNPHEAQKQ